MLFASMFEPMSYSSCTHVDRVSTTCPLLLLSCFHDRAAPPSSVPLTLGSERAKWNPLPYGKAQLECQSSTTTEERSRPLNPRCFCFPLPFPRSSNWTKREDPRTIWNKSPKRFASLSSRCCPIANWSPSFRSFVRSGETWLSMKWYIYSFNITPLRVGYTSHFFIIIFAIK